MTCQHKGMQIPRSRWILLLSSYFLSFVSHLSSTLTATQFLHFNRVCLTVGQIVKKDCFFIEVLPRHLVVFPVKPSDIIDYKKDGMCLLIICLLQLRSYTITLTFVHGKLYFKCIFRFFLRRVLSCPGQLNR